MSRRSGPPIILREFQQEAVDTLATAALDTVDKIKQAPRERRRIARRIGCFLLESPTGSGKTVMLAATAEIVSRSAPVVRFWFAPFAGLVGQTGTALRAVAPGLRVRNPVLDRADIGTRPGDVFVATWASVAARNADTRRMRTDDDVAPALDTLVRRLRESGFVIGAVVDEAHHSFRPGSQAFRFFDEVLNPDLLMCATATPDDADIEVLRRAMDVSRFQRISISRARVVRERLNKSMVRAVRFIARGSARDLIDLNETALRKAVDQHRALKAMLHDQGIPIVPLLLVQAASNDWTPARTRELMHARLGFRQDAVAVHTADEPDPNVLALANDPAVEVLIFKMAVATGFDAPRAFTLCALRPVVDTNFGLQVVGRIMRVHSLLQGRTELPDALDTGWIFLGDAEGQAGLEAAADRIKAIKDCIQVATDDVSVYEAAVGGDGAITVMGAGGQSLLVLEPPPQPGLERADANVEVGVGEGAELSRVVPFRIPETLFGQLADVVAPPPTLTPGNAVSSLGTRTAAPPAHRYPRRLGPPVPRCLRTEKMPRNVAQLLDVLIRNVRFTEQHLLAAQRSRMEVERREGDIFDPTREARQQEQAVISDVLARGHAHELLRVSAYVNPVELGQRLQKLMAEALAQAGLDVPGEKELRRAVNVVLVQFPTLLKDALRRAMQSCAEVVNAADLPKTWDSNVPLLQSTKNLYAVFPSGLNAWEQRFADWLDRQPRVLWWTRNLPRPNASDDWSARIVLPDTGRGYYPDFVVCVEGRRKVDGIALAETKERIESEDSAVKSRTEHREYGRALMVSYNPSSDRFLRVEFAPDLGRTREVGPLQADDLLMD